MKGREKQGNLPRIKGRAARLIRAARNLSCFERLIAQVHLLNANEPGTTPAVNLVRSMPVDEKTTTSPGWM